MSARDLLLISKILSLFAMFASATLATVAGILAYDVMLAGGHPISPLLFGPQIADMPGIAWIYLQQALALIGFCGAAAVASRSDWWRAGVVMMILGGGALAVLMGFLAHFASAADLGGVVFAMCLGAGLPWAALVAVIGGIVFWIERSAK